MADTLDEFRSYRQRMNDRIMESEHLGIKRFFNLDTAAYRDGALDGKTTVQSKAAGNGDLIKDRLRELEEEGVISRETEPRATLEEVRREFEEAWRVNPPKLGGLARFLESR